MPTWDPDQYLLNEQYRTRAAQDLLDRIPSEHPARVVDLGCGPANSTGLLRRRWPEARLTGVDSSPDMLEAARRRLPGVEFVLGDVSSWRPEQPVEVLFSNAVFQWIPDHRALFARLMNHLAPGGTLAVQVPANFGGPAHSAMMLLARSPRWRSQLEGVLITDPVSEPAEYVRVLAAQDRRIDVWETTYYHLLTGDDPVLEWVRGAGMRPIIDALEPQDVASFVDEYGHALRELYPPEPDGTTIFPFRRIFIVVTVG